MKILRIFALAIFLACTVAFYLFRLGVSESFCSTFASSVTRVDNPDAWSKRTLCIVENLNSEPYVVGAKVHSKIRYVPEEDLLKAELGYSVKDGKAIRRLVNSDESTKKGRCLHDSNTIEPGTDREMSKLMCSVSEQVYENPLTTVVSEFIHSKPLMYSKILATPKRYLYDVLKASSNACYEARDQIRVMEDILFLMCRWHFLEITSIDDKMQCITSALFLYDMVRENMFNRINSAIYKYRDLLENQKDDFSKDLFVMVAKNAKLETFSAIYHINFFAELEETLKNMFARIDEGIAPSKLTIISSNVRKEFNFSNNSNIEGCLFFNKCIYPHTRYLQAYNASFDDVYMRKILDDVEASPAKSMEEDIHMLADLLKNLKESLGTDRFVAEVNENDLEKLDPHLIFLEMERLFAVMYKIMDENRNCGLKYSRKAEELCSVSGICSIENELHAE
ncbi:uncharacterized protein NEMAJ01_0534 [Nematocida major]|uniref:uncharacterized protein n=1 Tax=Nematocida major TaxID=1912982 RepID=UPI0020073C98|nr:uncharacterized protein NEMAJ01_0534 [Nematocida major]KAH9385638.1 hypothetical protein NEMAJ01_0534 [Nematocida major]